jgi:hypothetical protein
MRVVNLLHHSAGQAGKVGQVALEQGSAEIHVSQQAVDRVSGSVIGRGRKQRIRAFAPVVGRSQGKLFLAVEVEETALREAGGFTNVLDAGGGLSLGADDVQGRIEQFGLRFVPYFSRGHFIPISWYGTYRSVGALSRFFIALPKALLVNLLWTLLPLLRGNSSVRLELDPVPVLESPLSGFVAEMCRLIRY